MCFTFTVINFNDHLFVILEMGETNVPMFEVSWEVPIAKVLREA